MNFYKLISHFEILPIIIVLFIGFIFGFCRIYVGIKTKKVSSPSKEMFKGHCFPKDIILQAVYFKLRFSLSYRDLEELLSIRGVKVDHATL